MKNPKIQKSRKSQNPGERPRNKLRKDWETRVEVRGGLNRSIRGGIWSSMRELSSAQGSLVLFLWDVEGGEPSTHLLVWRRRGSKTAQTSLAKFIPSPIHEALPLKEAPTGPEDRIDALISEDGFLSLASGWKKSRFLTSDWDSAVVNICPWVSSEVI